jgi:hypothetical protein
LTATLRQFLILKGERYKGSEERPSFPHALSGNLGEFGAGLPIKAFWGDGFEKISIDWKPFKNFVVPSILAAV